MVSLVIIFVLLLLVYSLSVSRKKQMEALKEAQNANAANIAKTTFLNHMSHDIRTPMNAIIGFTDIAMKRKPDKEVENCLKKIRQSSEYLMTLINDVLDISRIEGGLDYDTAYQLSDYFIQFSERLTSADRLTDLLGKVSYTFAEKVAQSKTPSPESADGGY